MPHSFIGTCDACDDDTILNFERNIILSIYKNAV